MPSLLMGFTLACCAGLPSCGGRSSDRAGVGDAAGGGAGGSITSVGIGGDSTVGGSMALECPASPLGAPATDPGVPPSAVGCYYYSNGMWQPTPCECEVELSNPLPSKVAVAFSFTFVPADLVPSLTDLPDVEVTFDDADASWYKVWLRQAQLLPQPSFSATTAEGKTTVRLGASGLTLDPVSLSGCARSVPKGSIHGNWGTPLFLEMHATLTDASGSPVADDMGGCSQPESHP